MKLNKNAIVKAKKYAKQNNTRLSVLVENYFNCIPEKNKLPGIHISPNVPELAGIIKLPSDFDLKKNYSRRVEEKYLNNETIH